MAEGSATKTPMVIEGYQVFAEGQGGSVMVKQEPIDLDLQDASKSTKVNGLGSSEGPAGDGPEQAGVRELLKQMVDNQNKELTVRSVVERLLQRNELILSQSDAQVFKPHPRTVKQKPSGPPEESHGSVLQPKDPTSHCTKDDITTKDINEALVEAAVNSDDSSCDPDLVCALGSKIILMTSQGQPLQMDLMCYWCNFCNFRTDKKDALLTHVMEHRFHCKYCKFQSFSRATVIHHCMEEHESFGETAKTLKYCTYLPDFLLNNEQKNKRKQFHSTDEEPIAKKSKTEEPEAELNMEVEEVDEAPLVDTSGERILTPRKLSKNTLPAPAKYSPPDPVASKAMTVVDTNTRPATTAVSAKQAAPVLSRALSNPVVAAASGSSDLPVIANVMSGQQAISAATSAAEQLPVSTSQSQVVAENSNVSVSSGLCWNCGYCGFVTLSQAFLKIHLNAQHHGKAHKYVAMLVSSAEEIGKIKASDNQLLLNQSSGAQAEAVSVALPTTTAVGNKPSDTAVASSASPTGSSAQIRSKLPSPAPKSTLPKPAVVQNISVATSRSSQIVTDNAKAPTNDKPKTNEVDPAKIPISFKCAHCNFSAPQSEKVKTHLFQRHSGSVMYALDMKAVKLRQKRYVFFCMKAKCTFNTKDSDKFINHSKTCTPWLDGKDHKDVDPTMVKSLDLTKQFIIKTSTTEGKSNEIRPDKSAEYGCIYCSYISNNNTRLKKHVLSNHQEKNCIIKDLQAEQSGRSSAVYFCHFCLWESRKGKELEVHLTEKHKDEVKDKRPAPVPSTDTATEKVKQSSVPTPSTSGIHTASNAKSSPAVHKGSKIPTTVKDIDGADSSRESSPTLSDTGNSDDSLDEEKDYKGLLSEDEYEKAMRLYIATEEPVVKKRGRPSRDAALKAQLKVKSIKPPQLFKCMHCTEFYFGVKLMRRHIDAKHKNQPFRAIDMLKQDKKNPNPYYCFCPQDKCSFCAVHATDVVNHAKNAHGIQATDSELVRISNVFPLPTVSPHGRPATAATGESYECLYCPTSKMYHSRRDMKKHLIDQHKDEDFIYRDCIARKLRQPSRFYMCQQITCDYTTDKQKDNSLHLLGHQETKIYECSKCGWFTPNPDQVAQHSLDVHKAEKVTSLEIDLKLDKQGNVVKLVGGTVIKCEKI